MGDRATHSAKRPRRIAILAAAAAACVLALLSLIRFAGQPERVVRFLLDGTGSALGLEIVSTGTSEYFLRGAPTVVVRDVIAREPGAASPLLRAKRITLSLPWSTVRARGSDLTVKRVELDGPVIDLLALQHWLDRRPSGETRVPTLTDGLHVRDGNILGPGWTLGDLSVDLPTLHPARAVRFRTSGRYKTRSMQVPFALNVALSRPAAEAAVGLAGTLAIERQRWRLPARVILSGRWRADDAGWRLDRMRLAATATYASGDTRLPFVLGAAGTLRRNDGRLSLSPAGLVIDGAGVVPDLVSRGRIALADTLQLHLFGTLATWPQAWPALPPPLDQATSALPFALRYAGQADLSETINLQLRREATRFDGRFLLSNMTRWIAVMKTDSPLPPLDGQFTTPRLEIAGAQLQGVRITFDDDMLSNGTLGTAALSNGALGDATLGDVTLDGIGADDRASQASGSSPKK